MKRSGTYNCGYVGMMVQNYAKTMFVQLHENLLLLNAINRQKMKNDASVQWFGEFQFVLSQFCVSVHKNDCFVELDIGKV